MIPDLEKTKPAEVDTEELVPATSGGISSGRAPAVVLMWTAGLCFFLELIFAKLFVPGVLYTYIEAPWAPQASVYVSRAGDLFRNAATLSGIGACALLCFQWLQDRVGTAWPFRFSSGAIALSYLSALTWMTLSEDQEVSLQLLLFTSGLGYFLSTQVGIQGVFERGTWKSRLMNGLVAMLACGGLVTFFSATLKAAEGGLSYASLHRSAQFGGELSFLCTVIALPVFFLQRLQTKEPRRLLFPYSAGLVVTLGVYLLTKLLSHNNSTFDALLYRTLRLQLFLPAHAWAYHILLSAVLGASTTLLLLKSEKHRIIGLSLVILLSAGFAPHTASRLLAWNLGIFLVRLTLASLRQPSCAQGHPR